jgi:hypothetical protein
MKITQEQKMYQEVIQKAWEDSAFKKELIANPLSAIDNLTGQKLNIPRGKTLVVEDQTCKETIFLNIPAKPNMEDIELNEQQLAAVAGGDLLGAAWEIVKGPYTVATEGFDAYVDGVAKEMK